MIKALVFDFDGLIFDTETHEFRVHQEIFREHGVELPLDVWSVCVGTVGNFDVYEYLAECLGRPVNRDRLLQTREAKFWHAILQEGPRPGVEAYLKTAKELGLKLGVASSSTYSWVSGFLKHLNLFDYFDCICTSNDVEHVKPDPALYRLALERLGVKPQEAVAFEDSVHGANAAKKAGLLCVVVPNSVTSSFDFGKVNYRLSSFQELDLPSLLSKLAQGGN